jgi:hypothetical protein
MRARTSSRQWLAACLCVASVLSAGVAQAQTPAGSQPDARKILLGMAEFLGKAERLKVTAHSAYDTVQASGQKIEWNEVRTLTISRPDRLRMEGEKSNGARSLVVFDGKQISAFDEAGRVYAQAPQPGGIDDTSARPHLVGRTDSVNFQVWIADAAEPVPQHIVLTYPDAPGQPQFRAQFSNWNLAAQSADSLFTFAPPADASRVPFAATVQYRPAAPGAPAKKGAKP